MELWIRTQNKEKLIKVHCIELNQESNLFWLSNNDGKIYTTIGTYKTKERALEVLNEIQRKIKFMYIFENYKLQKNSCIEQDLISTDFNIYEMPQDLESEVN